MIRYSSQIKRKDLDGDDDRRSHSERLRESAPVSEGLGLTDHDHHRHHGEAPTHDPRSSEGHERRHQGAAGQHGDPGHHDHHAHMVEDFRRRQGVGDLDRQREEPVELEAGRRQELIQALPVHQLHRQKVDPIGLFH